jgi:hypothetical protein
MRWNGEEHQLVSRGVSNASEFRISDRADDQTFIMEILRDTLYQDKIGTVLREYGANAWDAHVEAGKADVPIKVTVPTVLVKELVIRDYGAGLSKEDAMAVFTQYGYSTKRGTDDAVGMLGIGSKSGFAYSDTFMVTSWHGGKKMVFSAVLDESNRGTFNLLGRLSGKGSMILAAIGSLAALVVIGATLAGGVWDVGTILTTGLWVALFVMFAGSFVVARRKMQAGQ